MEEAVNHEPRPTHGDLLARAMDDQTGHQTSASKHKRRAFQYIMLRDHLLSGASIDKFSALELYGIKFTTLPTTISKLAIHYKWRLEKIRFTKKGKGHCTSYRVMLDKPATVEAEQPTTAAAAAAPAPPTPDCIAVEKVNVIFGKNGPEILIVGEGEPADKPPYKFTRDHLRYLFVNLKLFGEQAKDA